MTFQNADFNNIVIKQYQVIYKNRNIGLTQEGGTNIPFLSDNIQADDVEQTIGVVQAIERGFNHSPITTTMLRADIDYLRSQILPGRVNVVSDGSSFNFSTGIKNTNLRNAAGVLRFHPVGFAADDYSQDIYIHLAVPIITGGLAGSRDNFQTLELEWLVFPDFDQEEGSEYLIAGDWSISPGTPIGTWIQTYDKGFDTSGKSITAASIQSGEVQNYYGFSAYSTTTGITLQINAGGGYTDSDTVFEFDTLSQAGSLNINDALEIGGTGEYARITDIVYNDATQLTGQVTVETRGDYGTQDLASAISDDDVLTQYEVARINRTDAGSWASSVSASVVVGDTVQSGNTLEAAAKGYLTNGGTPGASNITFTDGAVASANFVVTAL